MNERDLEQERIEIMADTTMNYSKNQRTQLLLDMERLENWLAAYIEENVGTDKRWTSVVTRTKANSARHRISLLKRRLRDIDVIIKEVRKRTAILPKRRTPEERNQDVLLQLLGKMVGVKSERRDRAEAKVSAFRALMETKTRRIELAPQLQEEQIKTNPDRNILDELLGNSFKKQDYGPRPVLDIDVPVKEASPSDKEND